LLYTKKAAADEFIDRQFGAFANGPVYLPVVELSKSNSVTYCQATADYRLTLSCLVSAKCQLFCDII